MSSTSENQLCSSLQASRLTAIRKSFQVLVSEGHVRSSRTPLVPSEIPRKLIWADSHNHIITRSHHTTIGKRYSDFQVTMISTKSVVCETGDLPWPSVTAVAHGASAPQTNPQDEHKNYSTRSIKKLFYYSKFPGRSPGSCSFFVCLRPAKNAKMHAVT